MSRPFLPLRVNEQTPSVIRTAHDFSIPIGWTRTPAKNPYAEAEEAAVFIVCACNAHDDLVASVAALLSLHSFPLNREYWESEHSAGNGAAEIILGAMDALAKAHGR